MGFLYKKRKNTYLCPKTNQHLDNFMKKTLSDLQIKAVELLREDYVLLRLTDPAGSLPEMLPGQFVEVHIDNSPATFLRRPISINFVDKAANELWLLVHGVGEGTRSLLKAAVGDTLNCLFPLGNGFTIPEGNDRRLLLVGGGVGTAPLLYYGKVLKEAGHVPSFLLGGRSKRDLLQLEQFAEYGEVFLTTEDGSVGEKGFVTNHSVLEAQTFDSIATCGPKPMMQAVARFAASKDITCEASLENLMACGLGACLCCVEKTADEHNACVCKEGPVFNVKQLKWQISK